MEADSYMMDDEQMAVRDIHLDLDELLNPKFNSGDAQPSADKETVNLSDEVREIGSSCASITPASKQAKTSVQNITPSTCPDGELWDIQQDSGALNIEQPADQSSSNFPLPKTPLSNRPEIENRTSAVANNQPQLAKRVPNKNPSGIGGLSAANESSMSTLNLGALFPNSPLHFQREHFEPGLLSPGYGMYMKNHANFGQSPMPSAYRNFYPLNDNLSTMGLPGPSSFNHPGPSTEQANPSTTVEMILNNQVQPFHPDRGVNWENRNIFSAQSQNTSMMHFQADPLGLNVANNNMIISNVQQAGPHCATLVPHNSTTQMEALNGQSSWIKQQNPNGPFLGSGAPMHSSLQPRPQHPQYSQSMGADAFNLQFSNPTFPGPSTLRPPPQINNRSQLHSGVSGMPNFYNKPYEYSMLPGPSTYPGPQNFSVPINIGPTVTDKYDRQGYNTLVPNESSLFSRPSQFPSHQIPGNPDALNSQYYSSMLSGSSMPSRSQIPNSGFLSSGIPELQNHPNANSTPELSWLSGARPTSSSSGHEAFQHRQPFNVETTQGFPRPPSRKRSRYEIGEPSSKRFRGESSNAEEDQTALALWQPERTVDPNQEQASDVSNPPPPRILKNTVYDPMFEKIGLPVDPHIRMFSLLQ